MNVALIFAGGKGLRMENAERPKQFIEVEGREVIIHTLLCFEQHEEMDAIAVVCLEEWQDHLRNLIEIEGIKKVKWIVSGGETGQESIYKGLEAIYEDCENPKKSIVLVSDGVRPYVTNEAITNNLACVKEHGTSVTVAHVAEGIVEIDDHGMINRLPIRSRCMFAKAPQGFIVEELMAAHKKAIADNMTHFINSAELMNHYEHPLYVVVDSIDNLKITTQTDLFTFGEIIRRQEEAEA
ncbi:Ribitol-5-phosphate cytidylyltransferase [Petrocella atlantisensis]|uniref:Ribitol-5-phosphate cytidylyltransferase n=1 Tax=Petrocella atlantisensis TaxID=2173034 RepID=A0A3P7P7H0_9FIRM|nr:IspD/TarI family cytidylyltransferase [Petrocella atlantisensis]VDN46173.1 Ribitol-5-phosphate cytidylyltransferase [Petrocella atlantisensis]